MELLEYCSTEFDEMSKTISVRKSSLSPVLPMKVPKKKQFMYLYTNEGKKIKNMIDIPEEVQYLIASETKEFKDIEYYEPPVNKNIENH